MDPLLVVRTKNAHWYVRHLIVESTLVGDAEQPDGQRDTCREEQHEHDQALSETGRVVRGSIVGDYQCSISGNDSAASTPAASTQPAMLSTALLGQATLCGGTDSRDMPQANP
jgi:hypothetical protein